MQRRVVGGYLIEIEKNGDTYSVFVNLNGTRMLLENCTEDELKKLTDAEIIELADFRQSMANANTFIRNSILGR